MIGILGGTFDPIHYGHLHPAQEAQAKLALSGLRLIPAGQPPHRPPPQASAQQRLAMVELAIRDLPELQVDDRELQQAGPSYTINTLESLRAEFPETRLCLLLGADQFTSFETWRRWTDILDLAHIVVLSRPGVTPSMPAWTTGRVFNDYHNLHAAPIGRLAFVSVRPQDISATQIRAAIARGDAVDGLLPEAVLEYIQANHIYDRGD